MNVEELQYELQVMVEETMADYDDLDPDDASVAADLFVSMTHSEHDAATLAEVARREFGFVPGGARQDVADAFEKFEMEW